MLYCEVDGDEFTVEGIVVPLDCILPLKNPRGARSAIYNLVKNGTHADITGICREEKRSIMDRKTQDHGCCKERFDCSEGFCQLHHPQEDLGLTTRAVCRGAMAWARLGDEAMMIVYYAQEFLELLDHSRAWELNIGIDLRSKGTDI